MKRISEITVFPSLSLMILIIDERLIVSSWRNAGAGTGMVITPNFTSGFPQHEAI